MISLCRPGLPVQYESATGQGGAAAEASRSSRDDAGPIANSANKWAIYPDRGETCRRRTIGETPVASDRDASVPAILVCAEANGPPEATSPWRNIK